MCSTRSGWLSSMVFSAVYSSNAFSLLLLSFPDVFDLHLSVVSRSYFGIVFTKRNRTQEMSNAKHTVSPDLQRNMREPFKHRSKTSASTKTCNEIEKVYDCIVDVALSLDAKTCGVRCTLYVRNSNVATTYFIQLVSWKLWVHGAKERNKEMHSERLCETNRHHQQIEAHTVHTASHNNFAVPSVGAQNATAYERRSANK